ncbi:MAG: TPM domain-containing protein [Chloracidobacterium sp.]|nr:TPM domain-containing protein [Chloracidobacterium sp.]
MKKPIDFGKFVFFFAATLLLAVSAFAQETQPFSINNSPLPPSTGFVNDYTGVIDAATKQQLETKLKNLKETTNPSVEIAVAVVKTTGERDTFDYSLAVARGWKIGSKDDDNPSALLFVAIDDRKYYTQVSKDLEDELPDGLVGSLQRQNLVPEFRKGNYGKGISDTVDAYITTIRNKGNAGAAPQKPVAGTDRSTGGSAVFGLFCCGVIVFIILLIIFSRSKGGPTKGDRNRWGGGGFGGGGDVAGNIASGIIGGIIGSSLSGGNSSSDWGGSDSGGGWGGFGGGGDFGGGGSGGDW